MAFRSQMRASLKPRSKYNDMQDSKFKLTMTIQPICERQIFGF